MRRLAIAVLIVCIVAPAFARREFVADKDDFTCLRDWPKVRNIRVFHPKARKRKKAIKILEEGLRKRLPKGTILQIFPNEAMVKRGGTFNEAGNGWEFFALEVSAAGTTIIQRGDADVVNQFGGGSCQTCHLAAAAHDFVCEKDHGCVPLPSFVTDELLESLQARDPRCPSAD